MTAYNLTRIRPKGFLHSSGFNEVMDSLSWSLTVLGHTANVSENWIDSTDTNIIFGAELLAPNQPQKLPAGSILYNLEQPSHPNLPRVHQIAIGSHLTVWDYSLKNIEKWKELGVSARHVPIGYTPNLTRIPSKPPDIDVLLYGWMTPRRHQIVEELRQAGVKVLATSKCYGGGRDNLISRARICLNVHHDGRDMFEVVRVSYQMANYKCVISEFSSDDAEYSDLNSGLVRCDYKDIVKTVKQILNKMPHGFLAHQAISKRDYTETVRKALEDLTPQQKVAQRYSAGCAEGDMKDFLPWLRANAKGTCLEIGTRDGASTSALLSAVEAHSGVVLSLDIQDCGHLFAGHPQWKFLQSRSDNPKLRIPELDLLLIDGGHTREEYKHDLERFFPFVKPGGLILSHDIQPEPGQTLEDVPGSDYPSVAIREEYFSFCREHDLIHEELPGTYGMGVMTKSSLVVDSDESWQGSAALCQ